MRILVKAVIVLLAGISSLFSSEAEEKGQIPVRKAYMVANAHFDTQWRWTIRESISEFIPNTIHQNLWLIDQYPDYVFNLEGAVKYSLMKEYYPMFFGKVSDAVAAGRWNLSGSTWEANDTNIPSVESAFRNILLGQTFFKKEFGRYSHDIMLPDCFGFSYTLPTVAAHCGIIGFSTQKLSWRHKPLPGHDKKYPFEFGRWRGIDGSEILAAFNGGGYGWNPREDLYSSSDILERMEQSGFGIAYRYFGTRSSMLKGDRGGSPLPRTVRHISRQIAQGGPFELMFATSDQAFRDMMPYKSALPVYDGELLMDVHATGCYTSQAWMKALNRRNEQLAFAAESAAVAAEVLTGADYPSETLLQAWKKVILHQFHDDLTGTSIPQAYEFSWNDEIVAQNMFAGVLESSAAAVSSVMDTRSRGLAVLVYNPVTAANNEYVTVEIPLGWEFEDVIVKDADGRKMRSQILSRTADKAELIFESKMSSLEFAAYEIIPQKNPVRQFTRLKVSENTLENDIYKVSLDSSGDIASMIDKRTGLELVEEGRVFGLAAFADNKSDRWPAWEILKEVVDRVPDRVCDDVRVSIYEKGPLRASLKVERKYGSSSFVQYVCLTDGACDDRLDVRTDVEWNTESTLLKAAFPMSFTSSEAVYDLGLGHVRRGVNTDSSYEVCAQQWAYQGAEDGSCGVCIMNDSKYGWDKPDAKTLRLTLLHTPSAREGWFPHSFSQDMTSHSFIYSVLSQCGKFDPAYLAVSSDRLNQRKAAFLVDGHDGPVGRRWSVAATENDAVRIRCLKKAEDGDGYIVRLYEMSGKDCPSVELALTPEVVSAECCNGIEEGLAAIETGGKRISLSPSAFAPQTVRVRLRGEGIKTDSPAYRRLKLPYNSMAITSDEFAAIGRMDEEWNSYPGELIPDTLVYSGVPFVMGRANFANAVRCAFQKIELPEGCSGVYLLAASAEGDVCAEFSIGGKKCLREVPDWSGFFGQCGWKGHSVPYVRSGDIAFVASHRHNPAMRNEPYSFAYMYCIYIPVEDSARELVFPDNEKITIFAGVAAVGKTSEVSAVSDIVSVLK